MLHISYMDLKAFLFCASTRPVPCARARKLVGPGPKTKQLLSKSNKLVLLYYTILAAKCSVVDGTVEWHYVRFGKMWVRISLPTVILEQDRVVPPGIFKLRSVTHGHSSCFIIYIISTIIYTLTAFHLCVTIYYYKYPSLLHIFFTPS